MFSDEIEPKSTFTLDPNDCSMLTRLVKYKYE